MSRPRRTIPKKPRVAKPVWASSGICPACTKKIYLTKKEAKNAARVHHPHDNLSPYQCRSTSPSRPDPAPWHIGHLDEGIKTGELGRGEMYDMGVFEIEANQCTYLGKTGLKCSLEQNHKPQPHLAQTISGEWVNIEEQ